MLRRWLIRTLFLLPLTFLVGAWVISYRGTYQVYKWSGGHVWAVGMARGICFAYRYDSAHSPDSPLQYSFYPGLSAKEFLALEPRLGFYCGRVPFSYSWLIAFPLWLPTLLLAAFNWFVWRKTRRRRSGRGFPVEPTAATAHPSDAPPHFP